MKLRAILLALALSLAPVSADDSRQPLTLRMPNDCMILAMQAYARTRDVCPWAGLLVVHIEGHRERHALCVFEILDGSLWVYDSGGSIELDTRSRGAREIIESLERALGENIDRATLIH